MKRIIGSVLILLLVVLLVVFATRFGSEQLISPASDETAKVDSIKPSKGVRLTRERGNSDIRMHRNYESARFFSSGLEQVALEYGKDSPEWNSYALRWARSCGENLNRADVLKNDGKLKAGTAQAIELFAKFCVGVLSYDELEKNGAYQRSTRIEFGRQLSAIEKQGGVDAAMDFAADYLRKAEDPSAMRAALDYFQRIGLFDPPNSSWIGTEQHALKIYQMAKEGFICSRAGGCLPGHPLTLEFCIQHGCDKVENYQDLIREQLSPADRELYGWYLSTFNSLSTK